VTSETIAKAMDTPKVRAALRAKAARIKPRAQRLAYQAGASQFGDALEVAEGTRPGSAAGGFRRPYARVVAEVTEEMRTADAEAKMSRRSILRRASGA
jgi:hypothetical protein